MEGNIILQKTILFRHLKILGALLTLSKVILLSFQKKTACDWCNCE